MSLDNGFSFEIDFLPVGEGERSGDAIALRYGSPDAYWIVVIDGGSKESGERIVEHVRTKYQTNKAHLVINTHPDGDHSSGLSVVLEELDVGMLWLHQPWLLAGHIRDLFASPRLTIAGLTDRLTEAVEAAHTLEEIAARKRIAIEQPFQGLQFGPLLVLSPPAGAYPLLVPHFANTPPAKNAPPAGIGSRLFAAAKNVASSVAEAWGLETLGSNGQTTAQNESSAVVYGQFNGTGVLFTADAGVLALGEAVNYALSQNMDLRSCKYYQVPHHGSRNNVSPAVLDALLGSRLGAQGAPSRFAIASVGAGSPTHPRKVVTNAFLRRGVAVCVTKGSNVVVRSGFPERPGELSRPLLPLFEFVEE